MVVVRPHEVPLRNVLSETTNLFDVIGCCWLRLNKRGHAIVTVDVFFFANFKWVLKWAALGLGRLTVRVEQRRASPYRLLAQGLRRMCRNGSEADEMSLTHGPVIFFFRVSRLPYAEQRGDSLRGCIERACRLSARKKSPPPNLALVEEISSVAQAVPSYLAGY